MINLNNIGYTDEDKMLFRKNIDWSSRGNKSAREITIFSRTLILLMTFKDKFNFLLTGKHYDVLVSTCEALMSPYSIAKNEKHIVDNYYSSALRKTMIKLCCNILSNMNFGNRLLYVLSGRHYVPYWHTYKKLFTK